MDISTIIALLESTPGLIIAVIMACISLSTPITSLVRQVGEIVKMIVTFVVTVGLILILGIARKVLDFTPFNNVMDYIIKIALLFWDGNANEENTLTNVTYIDDILNKMKGKRRG